MKSEFIKKARENLEAADILFEKKLFNAAPNRAYYSAFQTAIAALIEFQLVSEKNEHRWVQATFSNELIRKRKLYILSVLVPLR